MAYGNRLNFIILQLRNLFLVPNVVEIVVYTFLCFVVFFVLRSPQMSKDSWKKWTVIVIVVVLASFSLLDFVSGCGGRRRTRCKYTVMCRDSV